METRIIQCGTCGAELDLLTMRCPYCSQQASSPAPEAARSPATDAAAAAPAAGPQPDAQAESVASASAAEPAVTEPPPPLPPDQASPAVVVEAPSPTPAPTTMPVGRPDADETQRSLGLTLFEAEESLARGHAEKALVVASKAVKEHPASLTARSLFERARREMLRGRRRERMEARLQEARALVERGSLDAAGKIVTSALKLVPDHELALHLFSTLKNLRLAAGTAEAEAEKELQALAQRQAQRAAEQARVALASGWGASKAVLAIRRGLRLVPDDPQLLDLLRRTQGAFQATEIQRARRRALATQVRAGVEFYRAGRIDESERTLAEVLKEEPENERALAGMARIRAVRLARQAPPPPPSPPPASAAAAPERVSTRPPTPTGARRTTAAIAPEIMLPRTRRRGTPWRWILAAAALLAVAFAVFSSRFTPPWRQTASAGADGVPPSLPTPPPVRNPLDNLEPGLKRAIETTIAAYTAALEKGDAEQLAAARPDLSADQRETRLAPFRGALNATTDVRVMDVLIAGKRATVSIQATDVIVGGRDSAPPPIAETMVFVGENGNWILEGAPGGITGGPQ